MYVRLFLSSIFFFFLSYCANAQAQNVQEDAASHPVKALYLSTIEAFNAGDLELFLANFSSDIKMYGTDGVYEGKEALRDRFKLIFQQFPNKRMEIPELALDVISAETVLVNFKWKMYPMGHGPAYEGIGSGIYVMRDHKWQEVLEVETVTKVDEALRQK